MKRSIHAVDAAAWQTASGLIVETEVWDDLAFYVSVGGGLYAVPTAHQTRITQLNIAYVNKLPVQFSYDPGDTSLGAPMIVGGSYA